MVISPVTENWAQRLDHLRRLLERQPQGPVWIWRTRVRILEYLLARYRDGPERPALATAPHDDVLADERPERAPAATVFPMVGVTHPPKAGALMSGLLREVQEINEARRIAAGSPRSPEDVWQWFRGTWCLRQ